MCIILYYQLIPHFFSCREEISMFFIESDVLRPETDIQLLNRLCEHKNGQLLHVPKVVLLVTSEADKDKYGSTVDVVMCKPIRASTIASCIQQLLKVEVPERENQNRPSFLRSLLVGKNILVVDDNKVNLRVAAAALKKYGANVRCVESGNDAISLLQQPHSFDACFMDVQMPEMDGYEFNKMSALFAILDLFFFTIEAKMMLDDNSIK
jgi:arabidopsis histidine kinase 2/3/4 (cytokinin receptor)